MGLRIQAYLLGVSLALISSVSMALGLGEITVQSSLNEPLHAEVELLQVRSLSDQELVVGLASAEAFERSGVERSRFFFDMKFSVELGHSKGPRVIVTSTKVVTEPFLNFILEAQWPSGRLLREYTVLIDLPVFSGQKAKPVRTATRPQTTALDQARTESVKQPRPAVSTPRPQAPPVSQQPASTPDYDGETYGPVKSSDTLWDIASRVRPSSEVSVQQTMLALQRLNPKAFISNNINLLRRGRVLRVPTEEDVTALSSRDAIRQVAEQNRDWNNRDGDYTSDRAQLEGSKSFSETRTESTTPEGRLKLSSEVSDPSAAGQAQGDDSGSDTSELEGALAYTQEELDAARRENDELVDRLRAMEEQVETMEKLLDVSSEEMRALELSTTQTNQDAEQGVEPSAASESDMSEVDSSEEGSADEASVESDEATDTALGTDSKDAGATESEAVSEPVPASQPVATAPKEKTIVDIVMENILYIGIAIAALVLGVIGFFFMRNKGESFDDDFDDFDPSFDAPEDLDSASDDEGLDIESTDTVAALDGLIDDELEDSTEAETEDVVAECDIHIAYGQYDQAEEKLLHALDKEPRNGAMRLKLLEVLAATNSAHAFDEQFARVKALGDEDVTSRAEQLRGSIDGIGPFDESAYDVTQFMTDVAPNEDSIDISDEEGLDSLDLGDDTLDFDDAGSDLTLLTEEHSVELGDELELSLDDDNDSLVELGADDAKTDLKTSSEDLEPLLSEGLTVDTVGDEGGSGSGESSEDFGDVSFDLDDSDLDLDLNEVELDVDVELGDLDEPQNTLDETDLSGDLELDNDATLISDVEENKSQKPTAYDLSDVSLAVEDALNEAKEAALGDDLELGEGLELGGSEALAADLELKDSEATEATTDDLGSDFDFDGDLESALDAKELGGEPEDTGSLADSFAADGGDLDFSDFDESLSTAASNKNMEEPDLSFDGLDDAPEQRSSEVGEFESEVNLEGDINLGALDEELDALASDFGDDLENVTIAEETEDAGSSSRALTDDDLAEVTDAENLTPASPDTTPSSSEDTPVVAAAETTLSRDQLEQEVDIGEQSLDAAVSSMDIEIPDFDPEEDDDSNLGFLSDSDETATKLDLARAYIDMGDSDGAKDILDEIVEEGDNKQKQDAESLLAKLG